MVAGIIGYRAYLGSLSPGMEDLFGVDWVERYRSYGRCRFDVFFFLLLCMSYILQDVYTPVISSKVLVVGVCRIGSARPTQKFAHASSKCLTFPGHVTRNR